MKNHIKAREFCEKEIFMEEGAKERLFDMVFNEIKEATSLKESMKNLCIKFVQDDPKIAIGVLETIYETLGLQHVNKHIRNVVHLNSEWKTTDRSKLFDEVFNSMYEAAKHANKKDLLQQLATYNEYITNHDVAKEIYEKTDPYKEYWEMVVRDIHEAPGNYTLKGLMEDLGVSYAHEEPTDAIGLLEAIYEALNTEKDFIEQLNLNDKNKSLDESNELSIDALFSEAFYSMYEIAKRFDNQDLLQTLENCYFTELSTSCKKISYKNNFI